MSVFFPSTVGIEFEWDYPEAARIDHQLLGMEAYFENTEAFTEEAKKSLQYDMATRFSTETDPDGIPWTPLAEPAAEQIGILQLTGTMRDAAISEEAWTATPVGVFFDTSVLPDYWIYHEQPEGPGAQRISQRKFIGASDIEQRRIETMFEGWVAGGITLGSRGFVGVGRAPSGVFTSIR